MSHQRVPQQATPPVVRLRRTDLPPPPPPPASLSISQTSSRLPRSAGIPPIRSVGSFRRVSWPCAAAGVSRFEILLIHPADFSSSLLQLLVLQLFHPDAFDISAVIIVWEIFFAHKELHCFEQNTCIMYFGHVSALCKTEKPQKKTRKETPVILGKCVQLFSMPQHVAHKKPC